MTILETYVFISIGLAACALNADEPTNPPVKYRGDWLDLVEIGFNEWKVANLEEKGGAADGGSIGYEFIFSNGHKFQNNKGRSGPNAVGEERT